MGKAVKFGVRYLLIRAHALPGTGPGCGGLGEVQKDT